jgi:hypothetical protein
MTIWLKVWRLTSLPGGEPGIFETEAPFAGTPHYSFRDRDKVWAYLELHG